MSNRVNDSKGEVQVGLFLDNYYYDGHAQRVEERELQRMGVDVIMKKGDDSWYVDEKCALDYINRELHTFAFELRSSSDYTGERYDGWLVSKKPITTHYLCCYVVKCDVAKYPRAKDIEIMETILIAKKDILDYLLKLGWSIPQLIKKCDLIDEGDMRFGNLRTNGVKFSKSNHKVESPINILLPKEKLIELATEHRVIYR